MIVLRLVLLLGSLLAVEPLLAQENDALVTQGRRIFEERGCYDCHAIRGRGGRTGADLTRVGAKYSRSYLTHWLRDRPPLGATEHMQKLQLTEPEVQALAAYLSSLRGF